MYREELFNVVRNQIRQHSEPLLREFDKCKDSFIKSKLAENSFITSESGCKFDLHKLEFVDTACSSHSFHNPRNANIKELVAKLQEKYKNELNEKSNSKAEKDEVKIMANDTKVVEEAAQAVVKKTKKTLKQKAVTKTLEGLKRASAKKITKGAKNFTVARLNASGNPFMIEAAKYVNTEMGTNIMGMLLGAMIHFAPDKFTNAMPALMPAIEALEEELGVEGAEFVWTQLAEQVIEPLAMALGGEVALLAKQMAALESGEKPMLEGLDEDS